MKDLLSYILNSILNNGVTTIEEVEDNGFVTYKITVSKEEMGKVIGKNGRIINSIKNILKVKAVKENKRVDVQVAEQA